MCVNELERTKMKSLRMKSWDVPQVVYVIAENSFRIVREQKSKKMFRRGK